MPQVDSSSGGHSGGRGDATRHLASATDATSGAGRLRGRLTECEALDRLRRDALAGRSRAVVLRGDAGVGKTALLRVLSERCVGWHVATSFGVESEMELAYSGLHQLCAPLLDRLDKLPAPQREALATIFGIDPGSAPDRFLVALATLTLLAEVAEQQPVVCIVDDAQWLDRASAQILEFVARRVFAERIAIVCAARTPIGDDVLAGLPELQIGGLGEADARALLLDSVPGPLDPVLFDQIVAESHGNPLALLELPRTWSTTDLAGGFGFPDSQHVSGRIERSYLRRILQLPADTQLLILAAAADPVGDPIVLHRAAETLAVDMPAADAAVDAGLLQLRSRVEFAHPLVRSAAYRAAAADDRRRVHRALAQATDAEEDPDRRAWHRARAAAGPDEAVALELEQSAGRAQTRGGLAAAAAFLQESVALTRDPARRADRALAAAKASLHAGAFDWADRLLAAAESCGLDESQRAKTDLLRAQIALVSRAGREASRLLLAAAKRLEPLDASLARETYLDAWGAAMFAGSLAPGALLDVSRAAEAAPKPAHGATPQDHLLDGLATLISKGRAAAAPTLRRAVDAFRNEEVSVEKGPQWGVLASTACVSLWDFPSWLAIITRQADRARAAGAFAPLAIALHGQGIVVTWCGSLGAAAAPIAEAATVTEATGTRIAPYGAMFLAAVRGREAEAEALIREVAENASTGGEGLALQFAKWARAVLYNGLGRYEDAVVAAGEATADTPELFIAAWALPELVEAATRSGHHDVAADALLLLDEAVSASDSDWGRGVAARSRALLLEGNDADDHYREAIERLSRTRLRPELARAHLLYGEWLRREGRRLEARRELGLAHDMLTAIGMEAFAERARRELTATGETVRRRTAETRDQLTPQEEQIARLALEGMSNPEIGARLYISARTVEWHLRKVFAKLDISSRKDLRRVLADPVQASTR